MGERKFREYERHQDLLLPPRVCWIGGPLLRRRIAELKEEAGGRADVRWFGHVELFVPFIEYHLHRTVRSGVLKVGFVPPFRVPDEFIQGETDVVWN